MLAMMAGGPPEAVRRLRPALEPWAGLVLRAGPAGAGTRAQLVRTLVQYAACAAAGIALAALADAVRHTDATPGRAGGGHGRAGPR